MKLLKDVAILLSNEQLLSEKYLNHIVELKGYMNCHIQNDWVLIYKVDKNISLLYIARARTSIFLNNFTVATYLKNLTEICFCCKIK